MLNRLRALLAERLAFLQPIYGRAFGTVSSQIRARSGREQALIGATALIAGLLLLQSVAITPLRTGIAESVESGEQAERDLQQVSVLAPEIQKLRGQLASVEERIQPGDQTNLLQLLETLAQQAEVKDKVESIRPKVGARNDRYPETRAEVQLRGATIEQTVAYLSKIETAPLYLILRSLQIKSRGDKDQTLDVTFSVSSFQRA
jgi:hypothetical protein